MGNQTQTLSTKEQIAEQSVQQTFQEFDKDESGFLEFDEIADFLTYQEKISKQQIPYQIVWKVLNRLDKDGDGRVSKDELKTMMLTKN